MPIFIKIMMCQCFYIDPETKHSVSVTDMPTTLPETIIKLNTSIEEIMIGDHYWTYTDGDILSRVRTVGDVSHIMIHRIPMEKGMIYIGLQQSGKGMRFTGFYSLIEVISDSDHEIIVEHIISEINELKNDTEKMISILVRFFGTLHLSHHGFSHIFENIRDFNI